ncbi:MAG: hypothetical protein J5I93_03295 [Pirellulaceae bacterium]|nr:hypothetical protein [Pirellulaceae bacterium]
MTSVRLVLPVALLVASLFTLAVAPASARADHKSYCYRGTCHHFHGESHVIEALQWMDAAALASCRVDEIQAVNRARRELLQAHVDFCNLEAKREVLAAVRALNRFVGTRLTCDLDEAAARALTALDLERDVHVRVSRHTRHHGGHWGHGHRPGHPVGNSISFGGNNFRVRIGF